MNILYSQLMGAPQGLQGLLQPDPMTTQGFPAAPQQQAPQPQPRGNMWDTLLDPENALPAAAAMMQGSNLGESIGGAFGAYGQAIGNQRSQQQAQKARNATVDFLRANRPDLIGAVESGAMTTADAFKHALEGKKRDALMNAGNGQIYDPNTGSWIKAPGGNEAFRQASPDEASKYGATGGQFGPDGRFYPINPPSGMSIESDGQGGIRVVQGAGAGAKPFSEAQSKDNVFATRAQGAMPTLDKLEEALLGRTDRALDMDPTGIARGKFQSPDYQVAKTAGDEFLQAILRKDTGAAITPPEQELYGKTYLPQPGDGPEVIAYKRQARLRAVEAIKSGMSPAQIIAQEKAITASRGNSGPSRPMNEMSDEELEAIANGR